PVDLSLLAVVGLHQLGVGEAFLSDRADRTAPAPCLTGGVPNHPREPEGHEPEEGSDDQRHQRELPLNVKQGAGEVDDAQDVGDHVPDAREDEALDRRHVVGEPGDHVTQLSTLEEIEREAVEMTKQPAAKRQDEPPSDPGRQVGIADGDGPGHGNVTQIPSMQGSLPPPPPPPLLVSPVLLVVPDPPVEPHFTVPPSAGMTVLKNPPRTFLPFISVPPCLLVGLRDCSRLCRV